MPESYLLKHVFYNIFSYNNGYNAYFRLWKKGGTAALVKIQHKTTGSVSSTNSIIINSTKSVIDVQCF